MLDINSRNNLLQRKIYCMVKWAEFSNSTFLDTYIFEWYSVDLRMDTKKAEVGLEAQNLFSILGSIANIIEGTFMII